MEREMHGPTMQQGEQKLRALCPQLSMAEAQTVLDALNVRALDRQADEYGDGGSDDAADLFIRLTGSDPHEKFSREEEVKL